MSEEQIAKAASDSEHKIKIALIKKNMTQRELAGLINEGPQQTNRAIKGDPSPKSKEIRKKISIILNYL